VSEAIDLLNLPADQVPGPFRVETYFDLAAHPFWHEALFREPHVTSVVAAVRAIGDYTRRWLREALPRLESERKVEVLADRTPNAAPTVGRFRAVLEEGARFTPAYVQGVAEGKEPNTIYVSAGAWVAGDVHLDRGSLFVGQGTTVERGAVIKGPAAIGERNDIRMGAYLRGDLLTGHDCTFRGELKNVVMLDKANFPHPGYVGDSLCGYMSHFGNQATAANLGIFEGVREPGKRKNLRMKLDGKTYDLGGPKLGIILGDFSQVGCNSVSDPGTFLAPYTIVYQLTRVNKGFYGPHVLIKNKPMEHGVVEVVKLEPLG